MGHYLNVVQEGGADADRSWPQKQFTLTVGAVCGNCNNGWMGDLEGRVKPFFEAALDRKSSLLDTALQRDLASWALKTAMMVEAVHKPDKPGVLRDEYSHLFTHGQPSPRVRVWVAAYTGNISTAVGHSYALDEVLGEDKKRHYMSVCGPEPKKGIRPPRPPPAGGDEHARRASAVARRGSVHVGAAARF